MTRLLHVSHQYRPAIGGSEQYFTDLSEELVRRGHQVDVATTRSTNVWTWRTQLPARECINGVTVRRFRSLERDRVGWHLLKFGSAHRRGIARLLCEPLCVWGTGPIAPGLAWYVARHSSEYDLIHLQTLPYAHVVYGYFGARMAGRPVIVTPHLHVEQTDTFDLAAFNYVLAHADLVIAVSPREVPYLVERGVRPERVLVAGNGVRLSELPRRDRLACRARLGVPSDAFLLLFIGRKVAYKGLRTILAAFRHLQERHPSLYLISAGAGTEDSHQLQRDYAGLARWTDLEKVNDDVRLDLLNACDVLLLPSTGEAFGIVFLEAWAVGKPVIGARAGAIPWVIDEGADGLLVAPTDPLNLAEAVEQLICSPELRIRLGRNGQAKVCRHYTVERITRQVEEACEQVVAQWRVGHDRVDATRPGARAAVSERQP